MHVTGDIHTNAPLGRGTLDRRPAPELGLISTPGSRGNLLLTPRRIARRYPAIGCREGVLLNGLTGSLSLLAHRLTAYNSLLDTLRGELLRRVRAIACWGSALLVHLLTASVLVAETVLTEVPRLCPLSLRLLKARPKRISIRLLSHLGLCPSGPILSGRLGKTARGPLGVIRVTCVIHSVGQV